MFAPTLLGRQIKARLAQEIRTNQLYKYLSPVSGSNEVARVVAGAVLLYFRKVPISGEVTEAMLSDARIFMATDDSSTLLEFGTRALWAEEALDNLDANADDVTGGTELLLYKIVGLDVSLSWVVPEQPRCNEVKQDETRSNQRASTPLAFI